MQPRYIVYSRGEFEITVEATEYSVVEAIIDLFHGMLFKGY